MKVVGAWRYVYRALEKGGQIVDMYVSDQRAANDAAMFFRRAIEAAGVLPSTVTADRAAAHPPALAATLPETEHETGKRVRQRIERDHQHRKGRLRRNRRAPRMAAACAPSSVGTDMRT